MTAKEILIQNFEKALEYLSDKGAKELKAQGYVLTGDLINSFEVKIKDKLNGVLRGEILVNDYGLKLNLSPNERYKDLIATTSFQQHVKDLYSYFQKRSPQLTNTERYFFALNTSRLHFSNQIPTKNSYNFSQNGKRSGWLDEMTKDSNIEEMNDIIDLAAFLQQSLDESIEDFLQNR